MNYYRYWNLMLQSKFSQNKLKVETKYDSCIQTLNRQ